MIMCSQFSDSRLLGSAAPDIYAYIRLYIVMNTVTACIGNTYWMCMCACWLRNMLWIMISCSLRITRSRIIIRPILPCIPNVRMCACTSCTGGMVVLRKFSDSGLLCSTEPNICGNIRRYVVMCSIGTNRRNGNGVCMVACRLCSIQWPTTREPISFTTTIGLGRIYI